MAQQIDNRAAEKKKKEGLKAGMRWLDWGQISNKT